MYLLFSQFFNSNSLQGRSRPTFYHQFLDALQFLFYELFVGASFRPKWLGPLGPIAIWAWRRSPTNKFIKQKLQGIQIL